MERKCYHAPAGGSTISTIPDELYEAAKVDGATPWQALWGITLLESWNVGVRLRSFTTGQFQTNGTGTSSAS